MKNVTLVVSTVKKDLPDGVQFAGQRQFSISPGGIPDQVVTDVQCTFANVPPGDYTATEQDLDSVGAPLGDPRTAQFTVPADTAQFDAADVLTVTLA